LAESLRRQGMTVELGINGKTVEESVAYGKDKHIGGMMYLKDEDTVVLTNLANGDEQVAKLSDIVEGGL
jgi:ATP phosphoribosyltransferase regulatory subunit